MQQARALAQALRAGIPAGTASGASHASHPARASQVSQRSREPHESRAPREPASAPAGEPVVLADRPDGTVVRLGGAVAKAHAPDTDADALAVRLRLAAGPELAGVLLPPLAPATVAPLPDGRPATLWPLGSPVDPRAPEAAPWEAAGRLLARLHAVPPGALLRRYGAVPPMRGPLKAAAALARMRAGLPARADGADPGDGPYGPEEGGGPDGAGAVARPRTVARNAVERAWTTLPAWCRAEEPPPVARPVALCHGDFHLGQLVRHPAPGGPWHLIDIDDLGRGDPSWDLARPAAWYAAGLLPSEAWERLLGAYQAGAGTPGQDPWPLLDHPARALTVQCAAIAVAKAEAAGRALDEDETALLDACIRIAQLPDAPAP